MYQTLQYREDGAVATIQLNRPQKKNSFNARDADGDGDVAP